MLLTENQNNYSYEPRYIICSNEILSRIFVIITGSKCNQISIFVYTYNHSGCQDSLLMLRVLTLGSEKKTGFFPTWSTNILANDSLLPA